MPDIPFNKPPVTGEEMALIADVLARRRLSGDGQYTKLCEQWLEERLGCAKAFLTHSCSGALEMAALLIELSQGDEVIMPSFTFSSTANAVVVRGATPVFADVDPTTMNIDVADFERLVTPRTKAIFLVHYAGRVPDMDRINAIAYAHGIAVVEDAAQSLGSNYKGRPAGTHSALATISFHESKNIVAGEAGALIINDPALVDRAAILREKGTNRRAFIEGQVDKYTWMDLGSSYLPAELVAAFLLPQLRATDQITEDRLRSWTSYHCLLAPTAAKYGIELPAAFSNDSVPNGHIFHILLPDGRQRSDFIQKMKERGIQCLFHYIPLHSAPAGQRFGKAPGGCQVTEEAAARLVRLPLYFGMTQQAIAEVCDSVFDALEADAKRVAS